MTKREFLERLRQALANDLSGSIIQENVNYYDGYISDEVRKGRSEASVIEELGDPWAIAKTIAESVENKGNAYEEYSYEPRRQNYYEQEQKGRSNVHVFGLDTWWKKLLLILGIVGVIMVVVAVVGGIVSFLAPVLVPLLVVMLIIRLIGGNRR